MTARDQVLDMLIDYLGRPISGEAISRQLGITRQMVWKHIKALRNDMAIESKPNGGYCLPTLPDVMSPAILKRLGVPNIALLDEVDSTNMEAKRRVSDGAGDNFAVVAARQTQGRGRRGRSWVSQPGQGLYLSIAMRPPVDIAQVQKITLLAAVSVCAAIKKWRPDAPLRIKWPNDVLLNGKKICGILCELISDLEGSTWVVMGIGVNLRLPEGGFPEELRGKATTLDTIAPPPIRLQLAADILGYTTDYLDSWRDDFGQVMEAYRQYMPAAGCALRVLPAGQAGYDAAFAGVDDDGGLLLERDGKVERIISGEISIEGMDGYV